MSFKSENTIVDLTSLRPKSLYPIFNSEQIQSIEVDGNTTSLLNNQTFIYDSLNSQWTYGNGGGGGGTGTPGGPTGSIQFNYNGSFLGTGALLWDSSQQSLYSDKIYGNTLVEQFIVATTAWIYSATGSYISFNTGWFGTITGNSIYENTISGNNINGNLISGNTGNFTNLVFTNGTGGSLYVNNLSFNSATGGTIYFNTGTFDNLVFNNATGNYLDVDYITGMVYLAYNIASGSSLYSDNLSFNNGTGSSLYVNNLSFNSATGGTIYFNTGTFGNLVFNNATGNYLDVDYITGMVYLAYNVASGNNLYVNNESFNISSGNVMTFYTGYFGYMNGSGISCTQFFTYGGAIVSLSFINATGNYLTSTYITGVNYLAFDVGSGNYMWFNTGYFNNLTFNNASGNYLTSTYITGVNNLAFNVESGNSIYSNSGTINNLSFTNATGNYLTSSYITGVSYLAFNVESGNILYSNSGTVNNLAFTNATGNYLTSTYITGVNYLAYNVGSGNYMWFNTGYFNNLAFNNASGNYLTSTYITGVNYLAFNVESGNSIYSNSGVINNLAFTNATGNYLTSTYITGVSYLSFNIGSGNSIYSNSGVINNLAFTNATGNYLDVNYITGVNYLAFDVGSGNYMWFNTGYFNNLTFNNASGNYLYINSITGGTGVFNNITASSGFFNQLFVATGTQTATNQTASLTVGNYNNVANAINIYGTFTGLNSSNNMVNVRIASTLAPLNTAVVNMVGLNSSPTFQSATGISGSMIGIQCGPTFICPSSNTIATAQSIYINSIYSSNLGIITNGYGCYIDTGGSGSGTITNGYGLYVSQPTYATNNYCAQLNGNVGINTTPSNNSVLNIATIPNNPFTITTAGTMTGVVGGTQRHFLLQPTMSANTGITYYAVIYNAPTYTVPSGQTTTSAYAEYINPIFSSSHLGTLIASYGLLIDTGSQSSGTVLNAYSMNVNMPSYGLGKAGIALSGSTTSSGPNVVVGLQIAPNLGCSTGTMTDCRCAYIYPTWTSNIATITNSYGLQIGVGNGGAGTITNGYSLYVNDPGFGSTKYTAILGTASGTTKVGIGIANPAHLLQCGSNDVFLPSATAWQAISDNRIKTNIRPLTGALNIITQLQPRFYDYTNDYINDYPWDRQYNRVGLIAQEVQTVLPSCVNTSNDSIYNGEYRKTFNRDSLKQYIKNYLSEKTGANIKDILSSLPPHQQEKLSYLRKYHTGNSLNNFILNDESPPTPSVPNLLKLNITDIHYYVIGAVKELSELLTTSQQLIEEQNIRISTLENTNNNFAISINNLENRINILEKK